MKNPILAATLAGVTLNSAAAQSGSKAGIKNVILAHGAFADGSGWEAVAGILKKDGHTVPVVQHLETSYADDIKFTKAVIDRQSGPVVLVGTATAGPLSLKLATIQKLRRLFVLTMTCGNTNAPILHDRQKDGRHDPEVATRSTTPIAINQLSA